MQSRHDIAYSIGQLRSAPVPPRADISSEDYAASFTKKSLSNHSKFPLSALQRKNSARAFSAYNSEGAVCSSNNNNMPTASCSVHVLNQRQHQQPIVQQEHINNDIHFLSSIPSRSCNFERKYSSHTFITNGLEEMSRATDNSSNNCNPPPVPPRPGFLQRKECLAPPRSDIIDNDEIIDGRESIGVLSTDDCLWPQAGRFNFVNSSTFPNPSGFTAKTRIYPSKFKRV